ncbi:DEAD/DEAH box helicase [Pseudanabaena sp. 'Roaring Creek']|uniref:DEAD/DEAH box helicase n=1 Tax=Pseudanabaena sp. 'Roaring Creek' TaxID=1681830 RepID=UPI0006D7D8A8|nr:DEAD/DEAH box helicase [Pseudanabaena sp. 'Roaring Creek']
MPVTLERQQSNSTITVQQQILDSGILTSGFSCILQMPTGSGKTWLAEQAIAHTIARGKRAIYLAPLKALASELTTKWQTTFAPHLVGVFTGDYENSNYPVPYEKAQLMVMTPEKFDACTRNWRSHWNWIPDVDLVVVDEFHLLGDRHRGAKLEAALMRFLRLNPFVRIVGLSATLGNRRELADWLNGVEFYASDRPIPLTWKIAHYKRAQDKPELLIRELERNLAVGGKSLVFVQSRRRAEFLSKLLQERDWQVAHHHAGLEKQDRKAIEQNFRNGKLEVLVATATLEMGLNLPARQVILYDLQGFDGIDFVPLQVNSVWQRAGRAGRLGLDLEGEVVLLSPSWDSHADQYPQGKFEPIKSGLANVNALAEQVITEVASGLCRTVTQLQGVFGRSLAAKQGTLPSVEKVVRDMLKARMLEEWKSDERIYLKSTKLGYVAMRHLLSPQTVLLWVRVLRSPLQLNFFDLILLVASCPDYQPLIPVDYEQLEDLGATLSKEPSVLLGWERSKLRSLLGIDGKQLLAAIHTALIARDWTRSGDGVAIAEARGCYAFEVECVRDAMQRLLLAMANICTTIQSPDFEDPEAIPLAEKVKVLERMISGGLDESTVTLTSVSGIGAKFAKRLKELGIHDLEDLALTESSEVSAEGISQKRLQKWIDAANEMVGDRFSAFRYREESTTNTIVSNTFPDAIDPYRLRRALELRVTGNEGNVYRVVGGLDPHLVTCHQNIYDCDCPDAAKGNVCKHILAVRIFRHDQFLLSSLKSIKQSTEGLDLKGLWYDYPSDVSNKAIARGLT